MEFIFYWIEHKFLKMSSPLYQFHVIEWHILKSSHDLEDAHNPSVNPYRTVALGTWLFCAFWIAINEGCCQLFSFRKCHYLRVMCSLTDLFLLNTVLCLCLRYNYFVWKEAAWLGDTRVLVCKPCSHFSLNHVVDVE